MPGAKRKGKKIKASLGTTDAAINSNTTIAALAMKGSAPFQRIIVYCCYGVILLGIIALSVPPYESLKELIALGLTVISLMIVAACVITRYRNLESRIPKNTSSKNHNNQAIPISSLKHEQLRTILDETRNIAFEFLRSKDQTLLDNEIRANIFLPEYSSPTQTKRCKLKICPGLHFKMDNQAELNVVFKPNQGATGNVFISGQKRVAQRLPSSEGDWDSSYNINEAIANRIHPNLKWVISMPLQIGDGKPDGVVNVDGLRCQFQIDTLYECMGKLTTNAVIMSNVLASN